MRGAHRGSRAGSRGNRPPARGSRRQMKGGSTVNQQNMRNLTLFDLLARSWELPSSLEALRFSADGSVAAFSCADGSIAIARLADAEPPESRIRVSGDLGQATIRPREGAPAPLIVTGAL